MMGIVSISLDKDSAKMLDVIQEHLGLKGRSEAVRTSVRMAEAEIREMEKLDGDVEGVLIVVHNTHSDHWMDNIQHKYGGNVRTQLHSHLQNGKCLEVMILSSDGGTLNGITNDIHRVGKADYVKFVRSR